MSPARTVLPLALAGALCACGITNPYAAPSTSTSASTSSSHTAPAPRAPSGLVTPAGVLTTQRNAIVRVAVDYALTQATWSPDTYTRQLQRLQSLATGAAAAQLATRQSPAAAEAALQAAGASSHATLMATDGPAMGPMPLVVVVAKVLATGQGRNPRFPDYQVCHVTLTGTTRGWLVSTFQIQP